MTRLAGRDALHERVVQEGSGACRAVAFSCGTFDFGRAWRVRRSKDQRQTVLAKIQILRSDELPTLLIASSPATSCTSSQLSSLSSLRSSFLALMITLILDPKLWLEEDRLE